MKVSPRHLNSPAPASQLRVAVTFRRPGGAPGPTKFDPPLSLAAVGRFVPDPLDMDRGIHQLSRLGLRLTRRGNMTASMVCRKDDFERIFGTRLGTVELDADESYAYHAFYFPPDGAPWNPVPELGDAVDDCYIQWPHIYMAGTAARRAKRLTAAAAVPAGGTVSAVPPDVDYFHLHEPQAIAKLLNVTPVHRKGTTGKGIRIAMIDSGFAHTSHPFFTARKFQSTVDLAPGAINDSTDVSGHGTAQSLNVFAVAPDATFIGIKVDNDNDPKSGATLLEGFVTALQHNPHIVSISLGFDLCDRVAGKVRTELPSSLAALEAEIQAAIAKGIVVVISAGNGHVSFPAMMPDVIAAGGVFVDEAGQMQASDYASAFLSKIYSGRTVPDFSGLVGMKPNANYIMLPLPPGCEYDRRMAQPGNGDGDGTTGEDGWSVLSGTSAAAPQIAGVCALLLERNPKLTSSDLKAVLRRTSRDVQTGTANPDSTPGEPPMEAGQGDDGATGAGLVDAFAAWQQVS